jgi:HSP20 family molecular chaperone IbpA
MNSDQYYQHHPRTIIPVTVNPNDDQRFIRFRSSNTPSKDIVHDRMSARMREFEEECRQWRERFFNEPRLPANDFPGSSSLVHSKPRMRVDFPDFPEFGSIDWPTFRGSASGSGVTAGGATHQSFIEEDKDGRKKYKIQFDIGEFRPEELNVKVEGRMLIVKGDRQIKVGNATESKQFNRELTLPEFVDIKTLQSYLSDDGLLTMEAPVLLDRVYNDSSALTSSNTYRQASPNRLVDTTFTGGRQPLPSYGYGNNQSNSYSSTSSTSSFRQDGSGLRDTNNFRRNSPLREPYSSTTSSTSTLVGGNNQAPVTFSTITSRPDYSTNDRHDGTKNVTYKYNLSDFAPEDIAIQVNDTMLKITALKQQRDGRGSTHREFRREIGK